MLRPAMLAIAGFVCLAVATLVVAEPAAADTCEALCSEPAEVAACSDGSAVWGFREPGGLCRGGSFGYLESRDAAEAERRRLARSHKRRCDEDGDCARFRALDEAQLVCLACGPAASNSAATTTNAAASAGGRPPPCRADEWLRAPAAGAPARCFVEFAALPPRLALQGRCREGDCRGGAGSVVWPTGERYAGSFRKGMRHGQGTFSWPDGRMYIGEWQDGQPDGLGTRIFADGRFKAGYFSRGRYLGADVEHLAGVPESPPSSARPPSPADRRSCEETCTEDADLTLARINDEYECCFARHAFCSQKARVAIEACGGPRCAQAGRQQQDDCDLHYACDAVQTEKVQRFRRQRASCVEGCASQEIDEHGLRVSERGTLLDD